MQHMGEAIDLNDVFMMFSKMHKNMRKIVHKRLLQHKACVTEPHKRADYNSSTTGLLLAAHRCC